jgi:hypothetical protein
MYTVILWVRVFHKSLSLPICEIFRAMSTIQAVLEGIIKPCESYQLHFLKEPRKYEKILRSFHFCPIRRENENLFVKILMAALSGLLQYLQCNACFEHFWICKCNEGNV